MKRAFILAYINPEENIEQFLKINGQSHYPCIQEVQIVRDLLVATGMYAREHLEIVIVHTV